MRVVLSILFVSLTGAVQSCATVSPNPILHAALGDSVEFRPLGISGDTPECAGLGHDREEPCRVRQQFTAGLVRRRLIAGETAWRDGDEVTFAHADSAENVILAGGLQMPMSPIHGSDLWVATVRIPRLDSAFISYGFIPTGGRSVAPARLAFSIWRGPVAPAPAPRGKTLRGRVIHDTVASTTLHARKPVSIYLPADSTLPSAFVVYMGDGQSVDGLAPVLDTLIAVGTLPRIMLVGAYSADRTAGSGPLTDMRSLEYLFDYGSHYGSSDDRFLAHDRFFSDDLVRWAETRWNAPRTRDRRAVFGFSNGGALAIQQGLRHPDVFSRVIAFSPAWQVPDTLPVYPGGADRATFFISGGLLEPSLHRTAVKWASRLSANGFAVTLREPVAGHDPNLWAAQLPAALTAAFRP